MSIENSVTETVYDVVMNREEQYSLWPIDKILPAGWNKVGHRGLKDSCFDYIQSVWTDMRPLSLRKQMAETQEWSR